MSPKVLMQAFYKRGKYVAVPCPADPQDGAVADWWWDLLAKNVSTWAKAGFTSVWLPPVTKAQQGCSAAALGYSVFDDYDIGAKNQKGTVHTRYGNREQLARLAAVLRANGLNLYLDLQLNHRKDGAGPDGMTFEYPDAFGNKTGGRFQKDAQCFHSRYPAGHVPADFHPSIPQDPGVPDGIGELQMGSNVYFGPDLAPINGLPKNYVSNGLLHSVDWLSQALDVQGYRLDHVQGVSVVFLLDLLNRSNTRDKFAVGEYWDGDVAQVNGWVNQWMQGRSSAFDFPLYFKLLAMSNDSSFNMADLDHAGLAGLNPFRAVTFVENHDTESRRDLVAKNIQPEDKPLAYAYILTSEGYPCVFFKDYSTDPGCLGDRLQPIINNLVWIHQNIADGPTQQRWKSHDVFVYERTGGARLLVGLNKNKNDSQKLVNVGTGFGPNVTLHDYTGHALDVKTDAQGRATLTLPKNANGLGYVCYSVTGITTQFATTPAAVTQVFEGAADLDIKPAVAGQTVQIGRIFCAAGQPIQGSLQFDATAWTPATTLTLTLTAPAGATAGQKIFTQADQGAVLTALAGATGFYAWSIHAANTPPANPNPAYALTTIYQAPPTIQ